MMTAVSLCRTYIVYHHGLFAQGVRSVLENQHAAQIVGMETNITKALKAMRSLKPEVIIVEECAGKHQSMRLGALLNGSARGRVVTLSLDHSFAKVYERNSMTAKDPADLIKIIRGSGKQRIPEPDQPAQRASMLYKPIAIANGSTARSGPTLRVPRTRKEEPTKAQDIPRAVRARKGRQGGTR